MTAAVMASSGQAAAAAPPVAILNAKYNGRARGSSVSKTPGALGGTTPGSYSNSFIDHAFDYPTPTSFSQLQFLSSSVASNDGADYTHRVPKVEERFCSGFFCCGVQLDDLTPPFALSESVAEIHNAIRDPSVLILHFGKSYGDHVDYLR